MKAMKLKPRVENFRCGNCLGRVTVASALVTSVGLRCRTCCPLTGEQMAQVQRLVDVVP